MDLLLFVAGFDAGFLELMLSRVIGVLTEILPGFPVPLTPRMGFIPDVDGAWLLLGPAITGVRQRVGTLFAGDLSVIFYGELFGEDQLRAPEIVMNAWWKGGSDAVRDLDGCFSAVIVERSARRCTVVSDLAGRRTLRYVETGGTLLVASHDAALVATGIVSPSVNLNAARWVSTLGWSLGGKPLLDAARICEPDTVLQFQNHRLSTNRKPRLRRGIEVAPRKDDGREILDAMTRHLRTTVSSVAGTSGIVKSDLTAGLDSRCLLALLLSVVEKDRIVVGTEGQASDLDVVAARRIAEASGIRHEIDFHEPPDPEKFLDRLDALAFWINGDTDGKRALTDIFKRAVFADPAPRFYGTAGEIFRGYYYPSGTARDLLGLNGKFVRTWLIENWTSVNTFPWKDDSTRPELAEIFGERLDRFEDLARTPVDLFDLFYTFERYGRWASFSARATWWSQYNAPFGSPTLIKLGFQLPAPLGYGFKLHRSIIRRYLPGAYFTPLINGRKFLPILADNRTADRYDQAWKRFNALKGAAQKVAGLSARAQKGSLDSWSARQMAFAVRSIARRVLLSGGSIASQLVKPENLERMLADLGSNEHSLTAISTFLTMERWKSRMDRAYHLATNGPQPAHEVVARASGTMPSI